MQPARNLAISRNRCNLAISRNRCNLYARNRCYIPQQMQLARNRCYIPQQMQLIPQQMLYTTTDATYPATDTTSRQQMQLQLVCIVRRENIKALLRLYYGSVKALLRLS